MQILSQLGANYTAFIQFIIFIIAITFLTIYVFNPYFKAYDERMKRTKGADAVASETATDAKNLALIYQSKAREINDKIKTVFDKKWIEGGQSAAEILNRAKTETEKMTTAARGEIEQQKNQAHGQIKSLATELSEQLRQKLEGGL